MMIPSGIAMGGNKQGTIGDVGRERSVGILEGAPRPSILLSLVHCTFGSVTQTHLLIVRYIV